MRGESYFRYQCAERGLAQEGSIVGVDALTVAQAKAKFSEVNDKARTLGPQTITRNRRKAGWPRETPALRLTFLAARADTFMPIAGHYLEHPLH